MAVSTGKRKRKADGREYDTPPPVPCTLKELDVLLDKRIVDEVFNPNQVSRVHRGRVEGPTLLLFAQLRVTSYYRMLGTPQMGTPSDQGRGFGTVPIGSSKNPTPKPKREMCSNSCDLCRSKGRRRKKSSPAYCSNYHLTEELQVQGFVQLIEAHCERAKDSYKGPGKHCFHGRNKMVNNRSHRWQSLLARVKWDHF